MHICYITNEYPKDGVAHGGVGSFLKTLAPELVRQGHKISIVGMNNNNIFEQENDLGVMIYRLPRKNVRGLSWWINSRKINRQIAQIHQMTPIDVVETAEQGLAFIDKIPSISYIIRLHGGHHFFTDAENRKINKWKAYQEKRSFAKADAFIAVSEFVREHTATHLSYHDKKVALIRNPIDTDLFSPQDVPIVKDIVFAGTVCEKKGVRQLIQAFPIIKKKFAEVKLHIYGRDWFFSDGGSYIDFLKQTEIALLSPAIACDVIFHGAVARAEMPSIFAEAAVCVFPSHMETLGLVAPEAMAVQKPVVFTRLGPGPEVIENGRTGWLCDPHDPTDIAAKICEVLADQVRAAEVGKHAREFVVQQFGMQQISIQNTDFYESLL